MSQDEDHLKRGYELRKRGEHRLAVKAFSRAVKEEPTNPSAYKGLGDSLLDLGLYKEAVAMYERGLKFAPDAESLYNNLGAAYLSQGLGDEAEAVFRTLVEQVPGSASAHNNLGLIRMGLMDFDQAHELFQRAVVLQPDNPEPHSNLALCFKKQGRYAEAVVQWELALGLSPDNGRIHLPLGMTLLLLGEYERGWKHYRWRRQFPRRAGYSIEYIDFGALWDGSVVPNKTILVTPEQGLGDTIQFCRYLGRLKELCGHVVAQVQEPLIALLQGLDSDVEWVVEGAELPPYDFHVSFLDLPALLNINLETIGSSEAYLSASPAPQAARQLVATEGAGKLKVGLTWAGNPSHLEDRHRSCPVEKLRPLSECANVTLFNLQYGPLSCEVGEQSWGAEVADLTPYISNFHSTSGLVAEMDCVISVDTSVLHLCGAVGVPVLGLLAYVPDWRWLLEREDSPWYRSVRLIRQTQLGDWDGAIKRVVEFLEKWPGSWDESG